MSGTAAMRVALLLRNIDQRNGPGVYARRITEAPLRSDGTNEYLLVFAMERDRERYGRQGARSLVIRAPGRLTWDQVAVPLTLRRERVDVVFSTRPSVPLVPFAPWVLTLHLRRRGLARAREFTWERTARATLDVLREAASNAPGTARRGHL